ncbi:MAG TPA: class I SAM-dependent methyltransferase [Candidatus Binataceae bacterium]|nr:class I SAM-dependent methyltransferase [Candidatus Binataceae bacterium]
MAATPAPQPPIPGDIIVDDRGRRRGLFAGMAPGRVLDIPAGGGLQTGALRNLGYHVVPVDLFPPGKRNGRDWWTVADANLQFPYRDASFDYVLSREGIEHLANQLGFIGECARVLRPGGKFVMTTPNMMHLSARASMFLTGQRNLRRGLVNEVQTFRGRKGPRVYHGHAFLLDYFRARYMLRLSGFDRLEVYSDRKSPTSVAMAPLAGIMWAAAKFSLAVSARNARRQGYLQAPPEVTGEILRHVFSPALLFGKRMIIVAERSA